MTRSDVTLCLVPGTAAIRRRSNRPESLRLGAAAAANKLSTANDLLYWNPHQLSLRYNRIAQIKTIKLSRFTNDVTNMTYQRRVIWSRCEILSL